MLYCTVLYCTVLGAGLRGEAGQGVLEEGRQGGDRGPGLAGVHQVGRELEVPTKYHEMFTIFGVGSY